MINAFVLKSYMKNSKKWTFKDFISVVQAKYMQIQISFFCKVYRIKCQIMCFVIVFGSLDRLKKHLKNWFVQLNLFTQNVLWTIDDMENDLCRKDEWIRR